AVLPHLQGRMGAPPDPRLAVSGARAVARAVGIPGHYHGVARPAFALHPLRSAGSGLQRRSAAILAVVGITTASLVAHHSSASALLSLGHAVGAVPRPKGSDVDRCFGRTVNQRRPGRRTGPTGRSDARTSATSRRNR